MPSSYSLITSASYANAANAVVNETQFNQISANDASFNDGTGIGDGVISGRQAHPLRQHTTYFTASGIPAGWTQSAGASTFAAISGTNIYCIIPTSAGTPWITLNEFSRWYITNFNSGRYTRIRIDALVAWDVATAATKFIGVFTNTGGATGLGISPAATNQILCRVANDAGTTYDQTISQAWSANTLYKVSIDFGVNDAKFYFNDVQIATDTTAAHFPSVNLIIPSILSFNTAGTQYVHEFTITLY